MLITRIEVQGFKSFFGKETMEISPGINVIVGPNGSGKSNLIDAFNWVLGEQSIKALRGERYEDVIFAGSSSRKPVGMAQVSLFIDNSDGFLPLDYSEIMITRRLYRSGESQFFINKVPCRLRDIRELFMGTGSGKNAVTVINQGQVDQVLNAKPHQRREILEEALGISKHLIKLRDTREYLVEIKNNMDQLEIFFENMEKSMVYLKKEAEKAFEYMKLRGKLEYINAAIAAWEIKKLVREIYSCSRDIEAISLFKEKLTLQRGIFERLLSHSAAYKKRITLLKEKITDRIHNVRLDKEKLTLRVEDLERMLEELKGRYSIISKNLEALNREKNTITEKIYVCEKEKIKIQENTADIRKKLENCSSEVQRIDEEINGLESKITKIHSGILTVLERASKIKNELVSEEKEHQSLKNERQRNLDRINYLDKKIENLRGKINSLSRAIQELILKKKQLRSFEDRCFQKLKNLELQIKEINDDLKKTEEELQHVSSKRKTLERMVNNYEGYKKEVVQLLRSKKNFLKGFYGVVGDLIKVPTPYREALEVCLGSRINNVVVESADDAKRAIEYLREKSGGRITFLPLDTIVGSKISPKVLEKLPHEALIAADIVEVEENLKPAVEYLLGKILVVNNLDEALSVAKAVKFRYTVVTKSGDIIHPGGALTGGSRKVTAPGILGRKEDLYGLLEKEKMLRGKKTKLSEEKEKLEHQYKNEREKYEEITLELKNISLHLKEEQITMEYVKNQIKDAEREKLILTKEIEQIGAEIKHLEEKIQFLKNKPKRKEATVLKLKEKAQSYEEKVLRLKKLRDELNGLLNSYKNSLSEAEQRKLSLEKELEFLKTYKRQKEEEFYSKKEELKNLSRQIEDLEKNIFNLQYEVKRYKEKEKILLNRLDSVNGKLKILSQKESKYCDVVNKINKKLEKLMLIERKLENRRLSLELTFENLDKKLSNVDHAALEKFLRGITGVNKKTFEVQRELKNKILRLEPVNLSTMEEYDMYLSERKKIKSQLDDLQNAYEHLKYIEKTLTKKIEKIYIDFFERIKKRFNEVYCDLFEGGSAELAITEDGDSPLNSGIEITVSPPGKKTKNLSLLSGGERALTALAFLFAILKERKSPFCILDEVDTSLDDVNVQRFARYLIECSSSTQFIVVSHRQGTMEIADTLYGVTMPEQGISKIMSLKLRDAG